MSYPGNAPYGHDYYQQPQPQPQPQQYQRQQAGDPTWQQVQYGQSPQQQHQHQYGGQEAQWQMRQPQLSAGQYQTGVQVAQPQYTQGQQWQHPREYVAPSPAPPYPQYSEASTQNRFYSQQRQHLQQQPIQDSSYGQAQVYHGHDGSVSTPRYHNGLAHAQNGVYHRVYSAPESTTNHGAPQQQYQHQLPSIQTLASPPVQHVSLPPPELHTIQSGPLPSQMQGPPEEAQALPLPVKHTHPRTTSSQMQSPQRMVHALSSTTAQVAHQQPARNLSAEMMPPLLQEHQPDQTTTPLLPTTIAPAQLERAPTQQPRPLSIKQEISIEVPRTHKQPSANCVAKPKPSSQSHSSIVVAPSIPHNTPKHTSPRVKLEHFPRKPSMIFKAGQSPRNNHSSVLLADSPAVLLYVAKECLDAARDYMHDVATSANEKTVNEYRQLTTTGLACLETAIATKRLVPRVEARSRLKVASILSAETDNLTEAENCLTKGIALCEKNHFIDLKYAMDVLLLRILFRRHEKPAFVAIDKRIADYRTYKQVPWEYTLRFLKAGLYLESAGQADAPALDNLRHIQILAKSRGDVAVSVLVSILEGLTYLKSKDHDRMEHVQQCIAQVRQHQEDPTMQLPQLEVFTLILDLACALHTKLPNTIKPKLESLMLRMDEMLGSTEWHASGDRLKIPFRKQPNTAQSMSDDTQDVLQSGTEDYDFIILSCMTKDQAFTLGYSLAGVASLYAASKTETMLDFWSNAVQRLTRTDVQIRPLASSLPYAITQAKWRADLSRYALSLSALLLASRCRWKQVAERIAALRRVQPASTGTSPIDLFVLYITGVQAQGTCDLETALDVFEDEAFAIQTSKHLADNNHHTPDDLAILAALNRIWIMQEPSYRDDEQTLGLLDALRPYCTDHLNVEIRTAFNLVLGAIITEPAQTMNVQKRHISLGVQGAKTTGNTQLLPIALSVMRNKLFDKILGQQAITCARAASQQARKSGNLLWTSVADGMLSRSCEIEGSPKLLAEAQSLRESGTRFANQAFGSK